MNVVEVRFKEARRHRTVKSMLRLLRDRLPPRVFLTLYTWLHGARRLASRFAYRRFWLMALVTGDRTGRERTTSVLQVIPYSLVGWRGLEATYDLVLEACERRPGALVECGVAEGGSAALMGLINERSSNPQKLWLFDSFEGLPNPTAEDYLDGKTGTHVSPLARGSCLGTYDQVSQLLFGHFGLSGQNVVLVKGWFDDTLPKRGSSIGPIAVLRIDADWYASVRCCLESLFDRVVDQGSIIIDDYFSCFGAKRAVDEFLATRGIRAALTPDGRGGCHFRKPGTGVRPG